MTAVRSTSTSNLEDIGEIRVKIQNEMKVYSFQPEIADPELFVTYTFPEEFGPSDVYRPARNQDFVAMEIGIEPTARHAADLGIVPVIVEDACGSGHAEAAQRSVEALKFAGDAVFTDAESFCKALQRKGG